MNGLKLFTLFGIPVYVSVWFAVIVLYWGWSMGDASLTILWSLSAAFSVLVHELGHGLVAKHHRLSPQILLHGLGGLCSHQRAQRDLHDAQILIAGPAAGFALGAISLATSWAWWRFSPETITPMLANGLSWMVWINLLWNAVNLLPLWPLDGGQLFRLALLQKLRPVQAEKITHVTGIALGLGGAALSYTYHWTLVGLLSLLAVYLNAQQFFEGVRAARAAALTLNRAKAVAPRNAAPPTGDAQ